ncbi:acyltransferase [Pendulispora brunnea]|uniref:Acyltransferase n=1 Tax=Pendulispora brunnea TaxID=2905690 RepID=A0ABZ2K1K8_9BACT
MNQSTGLPALGIAQSLAAPRTDTVREFGFDVLRSLACLAVIAFHAPGVIRVPAFVGAMASHGWIGVDLFFVLSGYLIGRQVFGRPVGSNRISEIRSFWIRRWTRTLPLYFVVLAFYAVIKPRLLHMPFVGGHAGYAFFLQNYISIDDFGQSWSLCVEEHFYLLFPLFALGLRGAERWPVWVWLTPALGSLAFRLVFKAMHPEHMVYMDFLMGVHFPTHADLDGISIGIFLACLSRRWMGWHALPRMPLLLLGILSCAMTLAYMPVTMIEDVRSMFYPTLLGISFGACLIGVQGVTFPAPLAKVFFWLATYSYGAYLWHGVAGRVCDHVLNPAMPWFVNGALYTAMTIGCAAATYHAIEVPGLRLRAYFLPATRDGHPQKAQQPAGEGEGPGDLAQREP